MTWYKPMLSLYILDSIVEYEGHFFSAPVSWSRSRTHEDKNFIQEQPQRAEDSVKDTNQVGTRSWHTCLIQSSGHAYQGRLCSGTPRSSRAEPNPAT